jgi:dipeptidyl aminopeptidase/acylaminoacyl peptidase
LRPPLGVPYTPEDVMVSLLPGMWRRCRPAMACAAMLMLAVGLAGTPAVWAQPAPPFTVDDMLKLDRVSDPQLSPDGTRVAFVVTEIDLENDARNNDIWIVPVSGGDAVRLVASPKGDDRPRWSPDGTRLAFVSARDGAPQIYTVAVSGTTAQGEPMKLTSLATGASGVVWSPDGRWLAFVSEAYPECRLKEREASKVRARLLEGLLFRHWSSWKDDRYSHLFVVPSDGSAPPRDLTPGAADVPPFSLGGPEDYAFSPDSREIAFVAQDGPGRSDQHEQRHLRARLRDPQREADAGSRRVRGSMAARPTRPTAAGIAYRAQHRAGFEADRWQPDALRPEPRARTARSTPASTAASRLRVGARRGDGHFFTPRTRAPCRCSASALRAGSAAADHDRGRTASSRVAPDGRTLVFSRVPR